MKKPRFEVVLQDPGTVRETAILIDRERKRSIAGFRKGKFLFDSLVDLGEQLDLANEAKAEEIKGKE